MSVLVASRVLQGIGGAMMMPVARLALLRAYPRSELLPVLNFVTMPGRSGRFSGRCWAAGWSPTPRHWIFLINIPIGLLGIFYARKYMPDFTTPKRRFDFLGFMLFGLSTVLISTGLELFGERGWRATFRWVFCSAAS